MRRRNESAVLRAVLASGPIARTDIARLTQLSAPSVTKVTTWLVQAGFLRVLPSTHRPENGRPAVPLALESRTHVAVGVHIGLLRTTIGVVGLDGSVLEQFELDHNDDLDPATVLDDLVDALDALWGRLEDPISVAGVGITIGGTVDTTAGRVLANETLGWRDVPIIDELRDRVPHPLWLGVNYRALAEAELWFGVGREADNFLVLFAGNITGAAIVASCSKARPAAPAPSPTCPCPATRTSPVAAASTDASTRWLATSLWSNAPRRSAWTAPTAFSA
jgi:hypothetical protein